MAAAIPSVLGAVGLVSQISAQNKAQSTADKAQRGQQALIDRQTSEIDANKPFMDQLRARFGPMIDLLAKSGTDALTKANQFDAGKQTEQALSAYDAEANKSGAFALGKSALDRSNRGFGQNTSESNAASSDIKARMASARGKFAADLRLGEQDRNDAVRTRANDVFTRSFGLIDPTGRSAQQVNALASPASSLGAQSQFQSQLASQFDPSGSIASITQGLPGLQRVLSRRKTGQPAGTAVG